MNHKFSGRRAFLEGNMNTLEHKELDTYALKWLFLYWHIMHVSKLVIPTRDVGKRPHKTDGALDYE